MDYMVALDDPFEGIPGMFVWIGVGDGTFVPSYLESSASTGIIMFQTGDDSWQTSAIVHAINPDSLEAPAADAGPDATVCGTADIILNPSSAGGDPFWTTLGDGFFDDPFLAAPTYTPGTGDQAAGGVDLILTVTATGGCSSSGSVSDTVTYTFGAAIAVNAGPDGSIPDWLTFPITAATSDPGTRLWTTAGDGSFDDPSMLTPIYTPGPNDIMFGAVTLTLTVTGSCGGAPVSDDLQLLILIDTDGDLVPDDVEVSQGTDPSDALDYLDTDGDLVPDYVEGIDGTDSTNALSYVDTDNGGMPDYVELVLLVNMGFPANNINDPSDDDIDVDSDGDLVPDQVEITDGTNPADDLSYQDSDGDLVPDFVEILNGTDPNDCTDYLDSDGDYVPDYVESVYQPATFTAATDPLDASSFIDSDNGGVPNYVEDIYFVCIGLLPTDPTWTLDDLFDTDADGVPDWIEIQDGTDPLDNGDYQDSDGDLVPDYVEVQQSTDPLDCADFADADADLVPDYVESTWGPNRGFLPTDAFDPNSFVDTDTGGMPDYVEVYYFPCIGLAANDPNNPWDDPEDSDGDGVPNWVEIVDGTDLLDPLSYTDTDGDLVPDYVETQEGTNPGDCLDYLDSDSDLVPDYVEDVLQPNSGQLASDSSDALDFYDTDTGGMPDYVEIVLMPCLGLTPNDPNDPLDDSQDTDGDLVPDLVEIVDGTDWNDPLDYEDSDGDIVPDWVELQDGTDPNDPTSYADDDNGGTPTYVEVTWFPNAGMDPTDPLDPADDDRDYDGDKVPDYIDLVGGSWPDDPKRLSGFRW